MISCWVIVIGNLWLATSFSQANQTQNTRTFPKNFLFGVATSAYQTEGAWKVDEKSETIWDKFIQDHPDSIMDHSDAKIACDSYRKYKEDVALAAELGMNHYRFSIAWSRIIPHPTSDYKRPSEAGIQFYVDLVNEIISKEMIPVATLYHWDLPLSVQEQIGGWTSEKIIDYFKDYAKMIINKLPKVGLWLTINEPKMICNWGYGNGKLAPGVNANGESDYKCAYIILKAHAAVYRMYKEEFPHYKANMSIVLNGQWSEPASNTTEDIEAAERRNQFEFGLYANPIFHGDWPSVVIKNVKGNTKDGSPRLPRFKSEDIEQIKGSVDFVALNTFTTFLATSKHFQNAPQSYEADMGVQIFVYPKWTKAVNGFPIVPWGMKKFLKWIHKQYNAPPILITENGVADDGKSLDDEQRIVYYSGYLNAVLDAIDEGVNVVGFTVWSLMDSFEWLYGYKYRFGLYHVDFSITDRTRTPKKSVNFFKELTKTYQIPKVVPADQENNSFILTSISFIKLLLFSSVLVYCTR